jgi:hypothetical protein
VKNRFQAFAFTKCATCAATPWRNSADKLRATMKSFKVLSLDDKFVAMDGNVVY